MQSDLTTSTRLILSHFWMLTKIDSSLQVILMDHVDWMDTAYAASLAATLAEQVVPGGKIIWRSAAIRPPYASIIAAAGFKVKTKSAVCFDTPCHCCISTVDLCKVEHIKLLTQQSSLLFCIRHLHKYTCQLAADNAACVHSQTGGAAAEGGH